MERKIKAIKCLKTHTFESDAYTIGNIYPVLYKDNNIITWDRNPGYVRDYNYKLSMPGWAESNGFEIIYEDEVPKRKLTHMQKVSTGEKFPVEIKGDNIQWSNGYHWEISNINKLPPNWKAIYEDESLVPEEWYLLNEEIVEKTDKYINFELSGDIDLYKSACGSIGSKANWRKNRFFIRKLPNFTSLNTINKRVVTIDNCKVGDKVIPGKDFDKHLCGIRKAAFYPEGSLEIKSITSTTIIFNKGFNLPFSYLIPNKELPLFFEEKQELQTSHNFKKNNIKNNESKIVINLPATVAAIKRGQGFSGVSISGKPSRIGITIKHLGNLKISI